MKYKYNQLIIDSLKMMITFFFSYRLIMRIIIEVFPARQYVYTSLWFIIPFFLSALLRFRSRRLLVYLSFHFGAFALFLAFPNPFVYRLIGSCFFVLLFIFSYMANSIKNYDNENVSIILVITSLLLNIGYIGNHTFGRIISISSIMIIISYFLIEGFLQLKTFVGLNGSKSTMPLNRLVQMHRFFLASFVLLCTVVLFFTTKLPMPTALNLNFSFTSSNEDTEDTDITDESVSANEYEVYANPRQNTTGSQLLIILLCIITVILLLLRIITLLCGYSSSKTNQDEITFLSVFDDEKLPRIKKKQKLVRIGTKTNAEKIRHQYYKTVKKYLIHIKVHSKTSRETVYDITSHFNKGLIENVPKENLENYVHIYNKARYSNDSCSKEDVTTFKQTKL